MKQKKKVPVIKEKEVEKIVNVLVPEICAKLEECAVCKCDNMGYITFGCCTIRLCLHCALSVCKTNKCAQCRRKITTDKMIHCIFKDDNTETQLKDINPQLVSIPTSNPQLPSIPTTNIPTNTTVQNPMVRSRSIFSTLLG